LPVYSQLIAGCHRASRLDPALVSRRPPSTRLPMFNDTKLRVKEMLTTRVQHPTKQKMLELDFYVAVTHKQAILGLDACLAMDLLAVQFRNLCTLQAVGADESTPPTPPPRPSLVPRSHVPSPQQPAPRPRPRPSSLHHRPTRPRRRSQQNSLKPTS